MESVHGPLIFNKDGMPLMRDLNGIQMTINQIHSIGDILFIEPICRFYWKRTGLRPTLVVRDHLMWLKYYIESASFEPLSQHDPIKMESMVPTRDYLPLRFANQIIRGLAPDDHSDFENMMLDKYKLANIPEFCWKNLTYSWDVDRARGIFKHLKLSSEEDYILVNEHCQAGSIKISPENPNNLRVIYMNEIPGYNVLDWTGVMLCAKEHHHVSTSTFFMLQAQKSLHKDTPIFIYPRPNEDGLRGISKLHPSFKYTAVQ